jgi:LytS/YehU family sensor histidine kinase
LPRALAIHLAAAAAVVLLRAAFIYSLDPWLGWYVQPPRFSQVALHSVQNNLFLYWLLVGASHAVIYARDAIERERAAVQLEAALGRAELAALTSTLHPHFLFNTLGAIAELVHRDPHATDRMVVQLAGMLRRLLDDRRPVIALADELAFSRDYLAIEQVRFGDLLTVRWSVEPDALAAAVPRLAIQPLIENALRHGLWPAGRPGVLTIAGHRRGDDLVVTVTDDGVGLPAAGGPGSVGQGLATIRARVDRLYDGRGALTVAPRAAGGTEARLVLPWGAACAS